MISVCQWKENSSHDLMDNIRIDLLLSTKRSQIKNSQIMSLNRIINLFETKPKQGGSITCYNIPPVFHTIPYAGFTD